jgi:hypothetical protein
MRLLLLQYYLSTVSRQYQEINVEQVQEGHRFPIGPRIGKHIEFL